MTKTAKVPGGLNAQKGKIFLFSPCLCFDGPHDNLLIETPWANLSRILPTLRTSYTMHINRRCQGYFILVLAFLIGLGSIPCKAAAAETRHIESFNIGYRILDLGHRGAGKASPITVAVWYPTAESPQKYTYGGPTRGNVAPDAKPDTQGGPYPLLVFSHGYGGSGIGSVFLTEPLAARGWVVAAPDHNDSHSAVRIRSGMKENFDRRGFLRYAQEIGNSGPEDRHPYLYRLDEMKSVLDGILESNPFKMLIDREKIAVGGHSFGGFTALGLCGTIDERRESRIRAVLLFSTGAGVYLFRERELSAVQVPSMYFLGEREKGQKRGTKTMAELANKLYRSLPPPKYLLEVRDGHHFSFNNRFSDNRAARLLSGSEEQFEVIRRYSIAFLNKHVAGGKGDDHVLEQQDPQLTRYIREQ